MSAFVKLAILSKAGLSVEQIEDRSVRLRVRSQIRFFELAAEALQDDLLGVHLALDYDLREIGLLYYVLTSCEVLNDALHKAARYCVITNEAVSLKFRARRETTIALDYVGVERRSDRHHIEFWLVSLVRLCRQLTNRRLIPSRVRVAHHRARRRLRHYVRCWDARLSLLPGWTNWFSPERSHACRSAARTAVSTNCC